MSVEWIRRHCLSFPHATEQVQWGDNLVFKVGGKMFAVTSFEPRDIYLSLKCTLEEFGELTELLGIIPAPYLARAKWIALENENALPAVQIKRLVRNSYDLVFAKLPKKTRISLTGPGK